MNNKNTIEKLDENITTTKLKSFASLLIKLIVIAVIIYTACFLIKPFLKIGTLLYTVTVKVVDTGEWFVDTAFGIKTEPREEEIKKGGKPKEKLIESENMQTPETNVKVTTTSHKLITTEDVIKYYTNHKHEINKIINDCQNEANERIFKKAIDNSIKFAEDYYDERNNVEFIKEKMSIELIDQNDLDDYIFIASAKINEEILKMILKCLKENEIVVQEIEINNASYDVLNKYLPNSKEMINQIYAELEKEGANNIPKSYLNQRYQELSLKHSHIKTITLAAYVTIAGTLLSKSKFPITSTIINISILSWIGYNELDLQKGKNEYGKLLRESLIKRKDEYLKILDNVINKIFEGAFIGLAKANYIKLINDTYNVIIDKKEGFISK